MFSFHHFFLDQEPPDIIVGNKYIMLWTERLSPPNFYVDALTHRVARFGDGASDLLRK